MSKRFGNFLTARDLRDQGVDAAAVRLLFWQTHYRKALDFTDDALVAAGAGVKRLGEFYERVKRETGNGKREGKLAELATAFEGDFRAALDDDLRSEEHTSELQSRPHLVCRLLLEKKKSEPHRVLPPRWCTSVV